MPTLRQNKSIVLLSRHSRSIALHSIVYIFASFCRITLKVESVYCQQQQHCNNHDIATTIGLGSRRRRIVSFVLIALHQIASYCKDGHCRIVKDNAGSKTKDCEDQRSRQGRIDVRNDRGLTFATTKDCQQRRRIEDNGFIEIGLDKLVRPPRPVEQAGPFD